MKKLLQIGTLVLTVLFFSQCKKADDKVFNVNFYTSKSSGSISLSIDGVEKGILPYLTEIPTCNTHYDDITKATIALQLKSGTYQIIGKNELGMVTNRGYITLSKKKTGVGGSLGGCSMMVPNEGCVSVDVFE